MGIQIITDNFVGNPDQFYSLVIEEINQRGLPGIQYDWSEEHEFEQKGLFKKDGAKGRLLRITFKYAKHMYVFCFQVGTSFFVSARTDTLFDNEEGNTYLKNVFLLCFKNAVKLSTKRALARHMESRSFPVPAFLAANDNEPEQEHESLQ